MKISTWLRKLTDRMEHLQRFWLAFWMRHYLSPARQFPALPGKRPENRAKGDLSGKAVGGRRMACDTICGQSPNGTRRRPQRPLTSAAKRAYPC